MTETVPPEFERLRQEINRRLTRLNRGEGIVLENDEAMEEFFDKIEAEVLAEFDAGHYDDRHDHE